MPAPTARNRQQQQQRDRAAVVARPTAQQEAQQQQQRALVAVRREIDNRMAIVEASGAAGIRPERLKLVALTAFTRNPDLLKCTAVSIARAIVEAGQLGLEPTGLLGGAYLVPRGGQATLLVGYKGLVILAKRSGEVSRVEARVVREKDLFAYAYGLAPRLEHQPYTGPDDPGNLTYAYAVIHYRDGSSQFEVMSKAEVDAIRRRSASPEKGPWVSDYFEMAKKTPLRRLMKLAPLSIEDAARLDDVDPEVPSDAQPGARRSDTTTKLRRRLQDALEQDYGSESPADEVEGEAREVPADGQGDGGPAVAETPKAEGAEAPRAEGAVQQEAEAVGMAAASAPAVSGEPGPLCGISHEGLQVGPCVLAAGHPQTEHEEAGGTRWTQPRDPAS